MINWGVTAHQITLSRNACSASWHFVGSMGIEIRPDGIIQQRNLTVYQTNTRGRNPKQSTKHQLLVLCCTQFKITVKYIHTTFTLSWSLRYVRVGRAKNAKNVKGMLFPMYYIFCLTAFSCIHNSNFKYSKSIFTLSRLKEVPWRLLVRWPSHSCFFHWSTQRGRTILFKMMLFH